MSIWELIETCKQASLPQPLALLVRSVLSDRRDVENVRLGRFRPLDRFVATAGGRASHSFPQTLQVHRAERAIIQTIAGASALSPNHASMIWSHRACEPDFAQRAHHLEHVDVAKARRMLAFMKLTLSGAAHVSAMHEVHSTTRAEGPDDRRQIVERIGAE